MDRKRVEFLSFLSGLIEDLKAANASPELIKEYEELYKQIEQELKRAGREYATIIAIILTELDMYLEEKRKRKERSQAPKAEAYIFIKSLQFNDENHYSKTGDKKSLFSSFIDSIRALQNKFEEDTNREIKNNKRFDSIIDFVEDNLLTFENSSFKRSKKNKNKI